MESFAVLIEASGIPIKNEEIEVGDTIYISGGEWGYFIESEHELYYFQLESWGDDKHFVIRDECSLKDLREENYRTGNGLSVLKVSREVVETVLSMLELSD